MKKIKKEEEEKKREKKKKEKENIKTIGYNRVLEFSCL